MGETIRVLIADDHAVVRQGLQARSLQPDVILLDLVMPRMDGLEAITQIKRDRPDARILVLTSFAEHARVLPAIKTGALGYLLKDSSPQELLQAIEAVNRGESSLHPTIARMLVKEISQPPALPPTEDPLTPREMETLQLVAQGLTNQEIADRLVISQRTVRNYVSNILGKLHLANRVQAALYALREGIVDQDAE
jgi:NarL family two-component system response regulator LiaR